MPHLVLSTAPHRFALAGFSLGGFVAQEILRIAPERVERLALLDTSIHADTAERAAARQRPHEGPHKQRGDHLQAGTVAAGLQLVPDNQIAGDAGPPMLGEID